MWFLVQDACPASSLTSSTDSIGGFYILVVLYNSQGSVLTQGNVVHTDLATSLLWHDNSLRHKAVLKIAMAKAPCLTTSTPGEQLALV